MNKFVEIKFNLIELKLFTRKNLDSMKICVVIEIKLIQNNTELDIFFQLYNFN